MKLAATALLAFLAGIGLVAVAARFAPTKPSRGPVLVLPIQAESVETTGRPDATPRIETAAYGLPTGVQSPDALPDVQAELTGWNDCWLIHYSDAPAESAVASSETPPSETDSLHLPVNSNVRLLLKSRDYVYMLRLPQISKAQIAVPGQVFSLDFRPLTCGTFSLVGEHICGPPRPTLTVTAIVQTAAEYQNWRALDDKQLRETREQ